MGYCIPCFGSSKHRKSLNKTHVQVPSGNQRHGTCETRQPTKAAGQEVEKKIEPIVDSKNKHEEKSVEIVIIKKVTFDLNVRAHEELPTREVKNRSVELENGEEKGNKKEATQDESQTRSDSSMSSVFTYPPSHRYHNCPNSDDDGESEAMEFLESDSDDSQESDSLFSISIESRNQVSAPEIDEKEVNSPIPVRSSRECELKSIGPNQNERRRDLGSVLNPVENLTQWRASKSVKPMPLKDQEKENIDTGEVLAIIASGEGPHLKSSNGDFKRRFERSKPEVDDVAVDTSLSSWLVESEMTSISKNSTPNNSVGNSLGRVNTSRRFEDRRILGALTVEELR
ncbi:hypothetical protein RHSIM_Rhsim09G0135500 [Rhododendron simsii]|uniref:Uncharacterized protein n=1 Tax=Rhododendron simsii TaxID=118357 RepID=A0A834LE99_RHOSS|nr:hypothetical protein RHSIM_Rhsim09G0135500 [Rhododendron simsii]